MKNRFASARTLGMFSRISFRIGFFVLSFVVTLANYDRLSMDNGSIEFLAILNILAILYSFFIRVYATPRSLIIISWYRYHIIRYANIKRMSAAKYEINFPGYSAEAGFPHTYMLTILMRTGHRRKFPTTSWMARNKRIAIEELQILMNRMSSSDEGDQHRT